MIHQFFDKIVCLTTARQSRAEAELLKYGIEAEFFRSLMYKPRKSFNMSMKAILERFIIKGGDNILILEDDVLFQNMDKVTDVFDEVAWVEWDVLYLGGNYVCHPSVAEATYISEHVRRIYNAWTTHAVAFTREVAKDIVRRYKADAMFDAWLDENILKEYTTIATVPMLAIQEPDYSWIWGHEVDYTDIWSRSIDFIR